MNGLRDLLTRWSGFSLRAKALWGLASAVMAGAVILAVFWLMPREPRPIAAVHVDGAAQCESMAGLISGGGALSPGVRQAIASCYGQGLLSADRAATAFLDSGDLPCAVAVARRAREGDDRLSESTLSRLENVERPQDRCDLPLR